MNSTDSASVCANGLTRPATSRRMAILCLVALAAGIGVATWIEVRGATSYAGQLQARTTSVAAGRAARIASMTVTTGQRVVPGEKLLELADDRLTGQITAKKRELIELEADVQRVKATADVELEWRRRELQSELFQTQLKATSVSQEKLNKQVEQLAWQEHLTGRITDLDAGPSLVEAASPFRPIILNTHVMDERRVQAMLKEDAAAAAAESLAAQLTLCEQQLERLKKLGEDLPNKVRLSAGVELAETRLARVREELSSLEQQRESLTIVSPSHGVVGAVHHEPGDLVEPGSTIIELFDDDRRHLTASIPSSAVARLKPGTKLTLIFPSGYKRIGLVAAIPPQAMSESSTEPSDDSQVAVRIEPAGKLWPKIPIGSRIKVQVPQ
ncbi:MAG: HlyD family efflux transporter periplasmic adaptor subunit [Planctomycetota bacterium]